MRILYVSSHAPSDISARVARHVTLEHTGTRYNRDRLAGRYPQRMSAAVAHDGKVSLQRRVLRRLRTVL